MVACRLLFVPSETPSEEMGLKASPCFTPHMPSLNIFLASTSQAHETSARSPFQAAKSGGDPMRRGQSLGRWLLHPFPVDQELVQCKNKVTRQHGFLEPGVAPLLVWPACGITKNNQHPRPRLRCGQRVFRLFPTTPAAFLPLPMQPWHGRACQVGIGCRMYLLVHLGTGFKHGIESKRPAAPRFKATSLGDEIACRTRKSPPFRGARSLPASNLKATWAQN